MNKLLLILWTIVTLLFVATIARGIDKDEEETGVVQLTDVLHRELFYGKFSAIQAKATDKHIYQGIGPIIITQPPVDCWKLFDAFMDKNRCTFQAIANKNCRNFLGCWCCPGGGLCITFFVPPTRFSCVTVANLEFTPKLAVREF